MADNTKSPISKHAGKLLLLRPLF